MFVYLGLFVPLENFSLIWRHHHCRFFSVANLLWPGSLASHTYCETGHPFIMVISEDQWHSHLLPNVWQWSCHYLFLRLRSVEAGIRTHNLTHASLTLVTHVFLLQPGTVDSFFPKFVNYINQIIKLIWNV